MPSSSFSFLHGKCVGRSANFPLLHSFVFMVFFKNHLVHELCIPLRSRDCALLDPHSLLPLSKTSELESPQQAGIGWYGAKLKGPQHHDDRKRQIL